MTKRIAVIGAGASGLAAIKSCVEVSMEPVCFEQDSDLGGLWRYSDEVKEGQGSVYKSCVANTSKEMMAYGDFPVPPEFPPFLSHCYILKYMRLYADHFDLLKHIKFNTRVKSITKADDFDQTGRWLVTYCGRGEGDHLVTDIFDGVMVCTGHHSFPHIPVFDGLESFGGQILHSHSYKRPEIFMDKKVLVVGCGNSAVDIAVDISRTASKVYLSTRRGAWIVSRLGPYSLPADGLSNSRVMFALPQCILGWIVETNCNLRADHNVMELKPKHGVLQAHPTINDDLPLRITNGSIRVKKNVLSFTETGAIFEDGTSEEFDTVIFATGYNYKYPFLDQSVLNTDNNDIELFKYTFPPHLKHHSLALIGCVQVIGSVIPASEIQARWYCHVMAGDVTLPSREIMLADIDRRRKYMRDQYVQTQRHALEAFWVPFMDEIAEQFGVKPNLRKMFFRDPKFALRCFFGPCVPAQYRLEGLGRWSGAKQVIEDTLTNTVYGIRSRTTRAEAAQTTENNVPRKLKTVEKSYGQKQILRAMSRNCKFTLPMEIVVLFYCAFLVFGALAVAAQNTA